MAVNQSGYGYLVDEAIRCMEERLHKNSLSLQEVADDVHFRLCHAIPPCQCF